MHRRVHRRRATPRDWAKDDDAPTLFEFIFSSMTDTLTHSILGRVRERVDRMVQWTARRAVAVWIGTSVLMAGILLVLFAGVKGLQALNCPLWLAYLTMGVAALAAALLILRPLLSRQRDEFAD